MDTKNKDKGSSTSTSTKAPSPSTMRFEPTCTTAQADATTSLERNLGGSESEKKLSREREGLNDAFWDLAMERDISIRVREEEEEEKHPLHSKKTC